MMISSLFRPACLSLALFFTSGPAKADVLPADAVAAIRLAADRDYNDAYDLVPDDAVTTDLVTWLRLRGGGYTFEDYALFLAARPEWPDQDRLRARAEEMLPKGTDKDIVLAWFDGHTPQTGQGAVRLAEALLQNGEPEKGKDVLAKAWLELGLSNAGQDAMLAAFPDVLEPLHVARVDALLWRWRTDAAQRMLPFLDEDHQAWVAARIALIRDRGNVDTLIEAVPAALRDTSGLDYDRYDWLAGKGRRDDAIALLRKRSVSAEALGEPFRWSGWRRSYARAEMRAGRIDLAYELASQHFLTEGTSFSDLEWLSGYLQLTYLDDPVAALAHFNTARAAVETPISVGRMEYWRGRALEAMDDPTAMDAYALGAQHQTGFYGLLASEKVGAPLDPRLTGADDPTDWETAGILSQDLIRAGFTLLEAGQNARAVAFFVEMGKTLPADDLARVGALLNEMDETYFEVVLGKTAVTQGVVVPSIYFPVHPLAEMDLPVAPALSLSIARRESEFNIGAGSPVGAQGLMQLMPATAQEVAGFLNLPYAKSKLTTDWRFNAQLGAKYLSMLEERFGPSIVQVAAGYNAGPSRPEIWMDERGDPRVDPVDVVDWIEHIPFRETRNYVMRVSESIPIYEARLSGETGPVAFTAFLNGSKPLIRPRTRPVIEATAITTSDAPPRRAMARPVQPTGPAAAQGIRPIARPGG